MTPALAETLSVLAVLPVAAIVLLRLRHTAVCRDIDNLPGWISGGLVLSYVSVWVGLHLAVAALLQRHPYGEWLAAIAVSGVVFTASWVLAENDRSRRVTPGNRSLQELR